MANKGQIDPLNYLMKVFTLYMDTSNTPNHRNNTPSPATFTGSWMEISMNFHGLETIFWPLRVYEHDTPP